MNRYDKLKKIDCEEISNKIKEYLDYKDEDFIYLCYILWKLKVGKNYQTPQEMFENAFEEEKEQCPFIHFVDELFDELDVNNQWEIVLDICEDFSEEELAACVIFGLSTNFQEPLQEPVLELVDKLLEIKEGDIVTEFLARDFKFNTYSKSKHLDNLYIGHEIVYPEWSIGTLKKMVMGYEKYNTTAEVFEIEKCDKIFINGNVDQNISNFDGIVEDLVQEWEGFPAFKAYIWDCCSVALQSLNTEGRAIAIISAGQLNGKETEVVRKFLIEQKCVEGVIALPDKMMASTWVNTYLVLLKKESEKVKFCDAREFYVKGRLNGKRINYLTTELVSEILEDYYSEGKNTVSVSSEELSKNDYILIPQRYVSANAFNNTICLGDIVEEISRGITLSASEIDELIVEETTRDACILPSSLAGGIVSKNYYFDDRDYKYKRNTTYEGDLLISKTGNPYRVAVAEDWHMVVGNIYILRIKKDTINPYYIKCFLESENGQKELLKLSVGAKTPLISVRNLKNIQIPVYEEKRQKEFETRAEELTKEVVKSYQNINNISAEINDMFK